MIQPRLSLVEPSLWTISCMFVVLVMLLAACGGAPRAQLTPMTAAQHERLARANDREAEAHDAARRVHASEQPEERLHCFDQSGAGVPYSGGQPIPLMNQCWMELSTFDHARAAAAHRRKAARHRRAAAELREVERSRRDAIERHEAPPRAPAADVR